MDKREYRVRDVRMGNRVLVVPTREGVSMGKEQPAFPVDGKKQVVTDYVIGLMRRGMVRVFSLTEPAPQPSKPQPPQPGPVPPVEE